MSRDVGIADRIRAKAAAFGMHLPVVEVAGWQTRGSSTFDPRGSVDHHTAGAATGSAPSLGVCINGRADLPGPLCNVLIARDNTVYVIAAGRANHAGAGGWAGLVGNSSVYGVERENVGYPDREPWRPDQTEAAALVHAALIEGRGHPGLVCRHAEWTPRKIDTHSIDGDYLRARVAHYLSPAPSTEDDDDMALSMVQPPKDHPLAGSWWIAQGLTKSWVPDGDTYAALLFVGVKAGPDGQPTVLPTPWFDMLYPLTINPSDPRHVEYAAHPRYSIFTADRRDEVFHAVRRRDHNGDGALDTGYLMDHIMEIRAAALNPPAPEVKVPPLDVDATKLAAELAGMLPPGVVDVDALADELASRLRSGSGDDTAAAKLAELADGLAALAAALRS